MSMLSTASCVEPWLGLVKPVWCLLLPVQEQKAWDAMRQGGHSAIISGDDIGFSVLFNAHTMLILDIASLGSCGSSKVIPTPEI